MTAAQRFLLVRLSAIGDIVFASPLIAAFRRAYPNAHLAWLVQPECAPLLAHHPDLDEVIEWPVGEWKSLWQERHFSGLLRAVRRFRAELSARRFDLAVDLQGLMKSGLATRLSGASERIGLGSREGSRLLMTKTIPRGGDSNRIGSEYLFLAQTLGLPVVNFQMAVHYSSEDREFARDLVASEGLGADYAVFCPFTTRPQKHWVEANWAELARRFDTDLGLPVVVLGGPTDREAAKRICDLASGTPIDLAGQTTLLQAAALIDRSALLVAVDTGLGHLGIAFDRPSLLLFGSTCPYLDTGRDNACVLYHRLSCSPCRRNPTCDGKFTCMRLITTDTVFHAAAELLGARP